MSDNGRDDPTRSSTSGDGNGDDQPVDGDDLWPPIPGQPDLPGERPADAMPPLSADDPDAAWSMTKPGAADPTEVLPGAAHDPPEGGPPPGPDPAEGWGAPDETAVSPGALGLGAAGMAGGGFASGNDGYGGGDDGFGPPGEPIDPDDPVPWYRERGPVAALTAGTLALIMIIIAVFVLAGDGDDSDTIDPAPDSSSTTIDLPTTTRTRRTDPTTPPTRAPQVPPTTPTTAPPTTTTTAPPTTPPTTAPPTTTTAPPTTTTAPPTTTTTTPPTTAPPTTTTTAPPTTTTTAPPTTTTTVEVSIPTQSDPTVLGILDSSPDLSKARYYVEQAGLRDLLDDIDAPVTFLVPTNDAFEVLEASPGGSDLLNDDARLRELLERHIIGGRVLTDDLFADEKRKTIGGDVLAVDPEKETIEGAIVLAPDVEDGNGVVHAIDRVLLP